MKSLLQQISHNARLRDNGYMQTHHLGRVLALLYQNPTKLFASHGSPVQPPQTFYHQGLIRRPLAKISSGEHIGEMPSDSH